VEDTTSWAPHCQNNGDVFSHGGGERTARQCGVPFLGDIPPDPQIRVAADTGERSCCGEPSHARREGFLRDRAERYGAPGGAYLTASNCRGRKVFRGTRSIRLSRPK